METVLYAHRTGLGPSAPDEIQIIPFGAHETDKGSFVLDKEGIASVLADFGARTNEMAIDYEHQSLTAAEAPAAGWITELVNKGKEGIWGKVAWTERAARYLKDREYRYLSPVFLKEEKAGRVVRLLGAGLTNRPAIDGMVPVVNTEGFPPKDRTEVRGMDELLDALGLAPEASEAEALEAVAALKAERDALEARPASPEVLDAMGLDEGAGLSEVTGTVAAMHQAHTVTEEMSATMGELKNKLGALEAENLVAQAMREGKITPAQTDWAREFAGRDPEGFVAFAAKAPLVLPLAGVARPLARTHRMDELQRSVNRSVGVSEEAYHKYYGPGTGRNHEEDKWRH